MSMTFPGPEITFVKFPHIIIVCVCVCVCGGGGGGYLLDVCTIIVSIFPTSPLNIYSFPCVLPLCFCLIQKTLISVVNRGVK